MQIAGTGCGHFTVKSCYRLLMGEYDSHPHLVWQKIWKLNAPLRIQNFLWRCAWDYLPKRSVLNSKRVSVVDCCPMCDVNFENITHILFLCPRAVDYWRMAELDISSMVQNSIRESLYCILSNLSTKDAETFASLYYSLWFNRNRKI